ncbi:unnamed protein product [Chrysoparadoxa australica]
MDNPAAWQHGINDIRVGNHALKTPLGDSDVLVKMKAVGICGSDVHYLKHGRIADFVLKEPMVIGHESAGIVEAVGSKIQHLSPGDKVALEPGVPCGCCGHCRSGYYNLCPLMKFFATPPVHGSLAEHIVHPGDYCYKLPEGMSVEEGAMCEPLSVGIHACNQAGLKPGHKVAVLGAGPIGLVTLLVAKAFAAGTVVVTDVSPQRLEVALSLGADSAVNVSGLSGEAAAARVREALGGCQPDVTVDCCGFDSSMNAALHATKSGGCVCLVGMGQDSLQLPLTAAAAREVTIKGVFRYRNTYPIAVDLISSGKVNVQPLITHRFDLTSGFDVKTISDAFEVSAKGQDAIKVMFNL